MLFEVCASTSNSVPAHSYLPPLLDAAAAAAAADAAAARCSTKASRLPKPPVVALAGCSGGLCITMPLDQLLRLLLALLLALTEVQLAPAAAAAPSLGAVDSLAGGGTGLLPLLLTPPLVLLLRLVRSAAAGPASLLLDACRTQLGGRKTPAGKHAGKNLSKDLSKDFRRNGDMPLPETTTRLSIMHHAQHDVVVQGVQQQAHIAKCGLPAMHGAQRPAQTDSQVLLASRADELDALCATNTATCDGVHTA